MSEIKYGKTALIADVATTTGLTKKQVAQIVNATLATIQQQLQHGQAVTLTGFGSFRVGERQARNGTHPQTRLPMRIESHRSARWKPAAGFLLGTQALAPATRGRLTERVKAKAAGR